MTQFSRTTTYEIRPAANLGCRADCEGHDSKKKTKHSSEQFVRKIEEASRAPSKGGNMAEILWA